MSNPRVTPERRWERLGHTALAVTIGASVAGFLIGVRPPRERVEALPVTAPVASPSPGQPPQVVDYQQMSGVRRGPNAAWSNAIPAYRDTPTDHYGAKPATDEERRQAVSLRLAKRAFSGAPPVVPHAIDERNAQACLVCHGPGMKVGTVIAPKMSHHLLTNCTQCHVESRQDAPWNLPTDRQAETNFVGLNEPGRGERIGPGAPPTIPHPLWMRTDCNACHGSLGKERLRTSHPWRANCTQCHAPSRGFDWSPIDLPEPKPTPREKAPPGAVAEVTVR